MITWNGFNIDFTPPYILGNTVNFTIGTNSAPVVKGTFLGISKLKPQTPVITFAVCALAGVGVVGVVVIKLDTSGDITIIENVGMDPDYLNSNPSYYVNFQFIFKK